MRDVCFYFILTARVELCLSDTMETTISTNHLLIAFFLQTKTTILSNTTLYDYIHYYEWFKSSRKLPIWL